MEPDGDAAEARRSGTLSADVEPNLIWQAGNQVAGLVEGNHPIDRQYPLLALGRWRPGLEEDAGPRS